MNNIKKLRKAMKLTQIELANLCNISQGALSGYENGRYEPDMTTLMKLADIFHVSTDEILGRNSQSDGTTADTSKLDNINVDIRRSDPKTSEARILAAGIDKMPEADRKRALDVMKVVFAQYAEFF